MGLLQRFSTRTELGKRFPSLLATMYIMLTTALKRLWRRVRLADTQMRGLPAAI